MINYYAPTVYQNAMGLTRNLSLILGGCTSLAYLVGSIIPLWSMDVLGRRSSLMISAAGLCTCFVLVASLLSTGTEACAYAATVFVFIFQIFLGIGYLPVPWYVILHLLDSSLYQIANPSSGSTPVKLQPPVSEPGDKPLQALSTGFVFVSERSNVFGIRRTLTIPSHRRPSHTYRHR